MVPTRNLSPMLMRLVGVAQLAALFTVSCGSPTAIADDPRASDSAPLQASVPPDGSTSRDAVTLEEPMDEDNRPRDAAALDASGRFESGTFEASSRDGSVDADAGWPDVKVTDGPTVDGNGALADAAGASDGSFADAPFMTTLLGSAARFAVFSGGTVENAAATVTTFRGDLGTYPGSAAVGLTPPVVVGTTHLGDGVARSAAMDIATAYDEILPSNLPCHTDLTGVDLGGKTLAPGVYCFASTAALTGTLTLDAQRKPSAVWVFQVGSALTTAVGSRVVVINGTAAQACHAFWQITSAATLGTNSTFTGNLLAYAAVTVGTGTSIVGRAFALTAKVTTDTNIISIADCPVSASMLDGG